MIMESATSKRPGDAYLPDLGVTGGLGLASHLQYYWPPPLIRDESTSGVEAVVAVLRRMFVYGPAIWRSREMEEKEGLNPVVLYA